jgi:hypothetical protein
VTSFIVPARQSRYLELFEKPKRREDITSFLAHCKHLDLRYTVQIAPREQRLLRSKGAPETCYAISQDLDEKELALADALKSDGRLRPRVRFFPAFLASLLTWKTWIAGGFWCDAT